MTVQRLQAAGLVPVVRASSAAQALALSRALIDGGVRAIEVTMTVPDASRVLAELVASLGEDVLVGAGTVTDAHELDACIDAGAQFVVTPVCLPELVPRCHARGVTIAIGAATPTEVWLAHRARADLIKVFPASCLGGASYLSALQGPFPGVVLMPTGGITLSNMHEYTAAGARVLGIGSALVDTKLFDAQGPSAITTLARDYCRRFHNLTRKNSPDSA